MASLVTPFTFPLGGPTGIHPTLYMRIPDDGADGVAADTPIWLDFLDGVGFDESVWVDSISVTVEGVRVFAEEVGQAGWTANVSEIEGGHRVVLNSPTGFPFGEEISVDVEYVYGERSAEIEGVTEPVLPDDDEKQFQVIDDDPEDEQWMPASNYRGAYALADRPAATTFDAGEFIFNTDAFAYNISDGTNWRTLEGVLT